MSKSITKGVLAATLLAIAVPLVSFCLALGFSIFYNGYLSLTGQNGRHVPAYDAAMQLLPFNFIAMTVLVFVLAGVVAFRPIKQSRITPPIAVDSLKEVWIPWTTGVLTLLLTPAIFALMAGAPMVLVHLFFKTLAIATPVYLALVAICTAGFHRRQLAHDAAALAISDSETPSATEPVSGN